MVDAAVGRDRERTHGVGEDSSAEDAMAIPLNNGRTDTQDHALISSSADADASSGDDLLQPGRALAIAEFAPPVLGAGERLIRFAYRMGVSTSTLSSPFRKAARPQLLATVESPLSGNRAAGIALRAGHFLVYGVKAPIGQMDFASSSRLTPPFERVVHGFSWLRDLAASAPREQCTGTAERILGAWLRTNPKPGKGAAWSVENAGHRLLTWLVHAPILLAGSDRQLRSRTLNAANDTARWLDRHISRADDGLGEVAGWCAIVAAGLLLPDGKPRRLFGETGLVRALGELVADDGGVLSRSPLAQIDAIGLLTDLSACYRAVRKDPPQAIVTILNLLVPPLLALRHGDGGLGNWQGSGAVSEASVRAIVEASGVRARPLKDVRQWGYQRIATGVAGSTTGAGATLLFDGAPPPRARHARYGCASTLAFELSDGPQRIIVNCGGAAFAGGQVPARIEQGLRATAAHSTLVLDDVNSTAVLIKGKLGKGVEEVEINRRTLQQSGGMATRLEASHDGYVARYGLLHRRILIMREDGTELRGEDMLVPQGKKGQRGKVGFAIRFHIGPRIDVRLTDDGKGAGLALPDGSYWQFRIAGDENHAGGELVVEESMWVDGEGRPQPVQQLAIQGMTSRSGSNFSWLLKKMG